MTTRLVARWRRAGAMLTATLVVIAVTTLAPVGPPAAAASAFSALAAADTLRVEIFSPSLPLSSAWDIGLPSAQAAADSLGQSRAYSSAPYPSDTVETLPGLAATLGLAFLPPYPLIIRSEAPTITEDEVQQGPLHLEVRSGAEGSSGRAAISPAPGVLSATANAEVRIDPGSGEVTATGRSRFDGIDLLDGLLRIGAVDAEATATLGGDGTTALAERTQITGLSIAGVDLELTSDGLRLAGTGVSLPLGGLDAVLAAAGLQLRYLEPIVSEDGTTITSAGVAVQQVVEGVLQTPVTVTYILGRARAQITSGGAVVAEPESTPPTTVSAVPPPPSQPASLGPLGPPVPLPVGAAPAPVVAAQPQGDPRVPIPQFALLSLYLVIIATGGLTTVLGWLFRHLGVHNQWTG